MGTHDPQEELESVTWEKDIWSFLMDLLSPQHVAVKQKIWMNGYYFEKEVTSGQDGKWGKPQATGQYYSLKEKKKSANAVKVKYEFCWLVLVVYFLLTHPMKSFALISESQATSIQYSGTFASIIILTAQTFDCWTLLCQLSLIRCFSVLVCLSGWGRIWNPTHLKLWMNSDVNLWCLWSAPSVTWAVGWRLLSGSL